LWRVIFDSRELGTTGPAVHSGGGKLYQGGRSWLVDGRSPTAAQDVDDLGCDDGVAPPTNSAAVFESTDVTQTFPEPSTTKRSGKFNPL